MKQRPVSYQRGQVLLAIVLVVTVVLTVSMSVMTRSIVNLKLSSEEDQSQKALSAAEAGIEQSLNAANSGSFSGGFGNSAAFSTNTSQVGGNNFLLNNGKVVVKNEGADIWLSDYASVFNINNNGQGNGNNNQWNGTLTIFWGSSSDNCASSETVNTMAAIEIIVLSGTMNNPMAQHYVYDPCPGRRAQNNFSLPQGGGSVASQSFAYSAQITVNTDGYVARIIPLYANTYVGVQNNPVLPAQGTLIDSTGSVGEVKRKVSVYKANPFLPSEFFTYTFLWPK